MSGVSEGIGLRRVMRALVRDKSGMAVVEFAFVAVFLIFLYLGSVQLADAIFLNRKITTTVRSVTDLTTQYSVVTNGDLDMILDASATLLAPYNPAGARLRISQVTVDGSGNAKVAWSRTKGTGISPLQTNADFDLPDDLTVPNTSLVLGEIEYTHTPMIEGYSVGELVLSDQIFMSPRASASVNLN